MDFQVIYTGLIEKKIRFMEREGVSHEEVKLKEALNPLAVENHIFSDTKELRGWENVSDHSENVEEDAWGGDQFAQGLLERSTCD